MPDDTKGEAIINQALLDLAADIAQDTNGGQPICTNWVLVAEWSTVDGQQWITRHFDEKRPVWQRNGLLRYAIGDWQERE